MGGMLLHLKRRPATPLLAAERCTNSTATLAALRAKSSTPPPDTRPDFLRWMFPSPRSNASDKHYSTLEDSLQWADVDELCIAGVGEHFYRQLQQGTEPFGVLPCSTPQHHVLPPPAYSVLHTRTAL